MSNEIEHSKPNGYSNELFCWLMDLEPGTIIVIDDFVESKTRHYFDDVVRWYIHCYGDVVFSGDYSKLRKMKPFKDPHVTTLNDHKEELRAYYLNKNNYDNRN